MPIQPSSLGIQHLLSGLQSSHFTGPGRDHLGAETVACGVQRWRDMVQSTLSDQAVGTKVDPRPAAIRITLTGGLFGFEQHQTWQLIADPNELPFQRLRACDDSRLTFLVVPPFFVEPEYKPDVSAEDVAFLELGEPDDAWVLNVVTVHDGGRATVNLKGPILLNRRTLIGKQVVPANAAHYSLQHPLPIAH